MRSGSIDGFDFSPPNSIRDVAFYPLVAISVLIVIYTFGEVVVWSILAWAPGYEHDADRLFHIVGGMLIAILVGSLIAQFVRPHKSTGSMLLAVVTGFSLTLVAAAIDGIAGIGVIGIALIPIGLVVLIHPTRERLTVYQAVPLRRHLLVGIVGGLFFGYTAMALIATHPTSEVGHDILLPSSILTIAFASLLVPIRSTSWRPLGWSIGLIGGGYAGGSLLYPSANAALPPITALLVLAYVVVFVLGRERSDRLSPARL